MVDVARWRARFRWLDRALRVQERFGAVSGGPLSSSLALATFLSIFPLLLVAIAVVGFISSGNRDFTGNVIDALGVHGQGARLVREAITTAEQSRRTASIIGIIGLVWAGLAVVGALQAVCNGVWQTHGRGIRDRGLAVLWLAGAGTAFFLSIAIGSLTSLLPGPLGLLSIVVGVAITGAVFVWTYGYLGNQPLPWRAHLPGAVGVAIAFEVLKQIGVFWFPRMTSRSSALYGTLGVVFAAIAWIAIYARVVVYGAVVNVVRWEEQHGTVTVDIEAPKLDGPTPFIADRGGAVEEPKGA